MAAPVVEDVEGPLVISGGGDGAVRSWRLDGRAAHLAVEDAHTLSVGAVAPIKRVEGGLVASGGSFDGSIVAHMPPPRGNAAWDEDVRITSEKNPGIAIPPMRGALAEREGP